MDEVTVYECVDGFIAGVPFEIILEWSSADPWAVNLCFGEQTEWMVSRELLSKGMDSGAGEGDITVSPQFLGGELLPLALIYLQSPDGAAYVQITREGVLDFLVRTYEIVPAGSETIPDSEYEHLLEGTS